MLGTIIGNNGTRALVPTYNVKNFSTVISRYKILVVADNIW